MRRERPREERRRAQLEVGLRRVIRVMTFWFSRR
jgi:hypothetical protein